MIAGINGTCKDIDIPESTDSKNNASYSSQIEPHTERIMTQESSLNTFPMHSSCRDNWHGAAEKHQGYTHSVSDPPFDPPYANVQHWISTPIPPSPRRPPVSWEPWNEWALQRSHPQSQPGDIVSDGGLFQSSHPDVRVIEEDLFQKSQPDGPVNEYHLFQPLASQEYDLNGDEVGSVQHWIEQLDKFVVADQPDSPQDVVADEGFNQESELATASRPSSPGSWSIGRTMASVITEPSSLGTKTGLLAKSSRENAKAMRHKGSCFRCFLMRRRCVLDEQSASDGICESCRKLRNINRTRGLPCSEIGLDQRGIFMLPEALVLPLKASQVRDFVKDSVQGIVPNSSIRLALTIGFGEPLRLNAVEVVPRGRGATHMLGYSMSSTGQAIALRLESPPIMPVLADRLAIRRHINCWLDTIITEEDSELPEHCFPGAHELWQKEILTIICQYHREHLPHLERVGEGAYQTLRWALKLTVLNHIMCHPFVVPDDEVEALYRQLRYHHPASSLRWICPRLANRIVKHILLPMLKHTIDRVLGGLQKMLRTRGADSSRWDQAFCVVFLCLIFVGKTQVSLVEHALTKLSNNDNSFTIIDAKFQTTQMEAEVSTHLIGMFHHRFGTMKRGSAEGKVYNPFSRNPRSRQEVESRLTESVRSATNTYGIQFAYGWRLQMC
jgi:hypothetical protein